MLLTFCWRLFVWEKKCVIFMYPSRNHKHTFTHNPAMWVSVSKTVNFVCWNHLACNSITVSFRPEGAQQRFILLTFVAVVFHRSCTQENSQKIWWITKIRVLLRCTTCVCQNSEQINLKQKCLFFEQIFAECPEGTDW